MIIVPGFQNGYARNASESRYPGLWKGLTGYWSPAIGRQGMALRDLSGYRGHMASTGLTQTSWAPGRRGHTLKYVAASSQGFAATTSRWIAGADIPFTIAVFAVRDTTSAVAHTLVAKYNTTGNQREYRIFLDTAHAPRIGVSSDGTSGTVTEVVSSATPAIGVWFSLICWHDSNANVIGVTVNGGTTTTAAHTTGVFSTGTADITIGHRSGADYHEGRIGPVGFWRRLLSTSEKELIASGASPLDMRRTIVGFVPSAHTNDLVVNSTLDSLTLVSTIDAVVDVIVNATLESLTVVSTIEGSVDATLDVTLDNLTSDAEIQTEPSMTFDQTLDDLTLDASIETTDVEPPEPEPTPPRSSHGRPSKSVRRRRREVRIGEYLGPKPPPIALPKSDVPTIPLVPVVSSIVLAPLVLDARFFVAHKPQVPTLPTLPAKFVPGIVLTVSQKLAAERKAAEAARLAAIPPRPIEPTDEELALIVLALLDK